MLKSIFGRWQRTAISLLKGGAVDDPMSVRESSGEGVVGSTPRTDGDAVYNPITADALRKISDDIGIDDAARQWMDALHAEAMKTYGDTPYVPLIDTGSIVRRQNEANKALTPGPRADVLRLLMAASLLLPGPECWETGIHKYARVFWLDIFEEAFDLSVRKKAKLSTVQIADMLELASKLEHPKSKGWSIPLLIRQLRWNIKASPPDAQTMTRLRNFANDPWFELPDYRYGPDRGKAQTQLIALTGGLNQGDPNAEVKPLFKFQGCAFDVHMKKTFNAAEPDARRQWNALFGIAKTKFGAKPSAKTVKAMADIRAAMPDFENQIVAMLRAASASGSFRNGMEQHRYAPEDTPSPTMQSLLKTAVWAMADSDHPELVPALQKLGARAFDTVAGHGPRALGLANAIVAVLAKKGLPGLAALSSVRLKVRQPSARKKIDAVIASEAEALGVSPGRLQEMAVPTLGLTMGRRDWAMGDYTLTLDARRPGKAQLSWTRPDGKPMKSVPAAVKQDEALTAQLKAARALAKEAKSALSVQKDRIDQMFVDSPSWSADDHRSAYLDHPLIGPMSRTLIWTVDGTPALYRNDAWEDVAGKTISSAETIGLWHPIQSATEDVLAWRARLESLEIVQPFKQAHREVYLLTDAEVNTGTYSNRMAAHILKQHQFRALAGLRGWAYSLMGAYDDGRDNETATRPLRAHGLDAQFWIDELPNDESWNDAGIWNFVATDQIRFVESGTDTVLPVASVPPLVFSEVMRDCDLFVGVASVGNDPAWLDAGAARTAPARDYWHSYAFGDLSELAKTRKTLLASLLPRLKIADRVEIKDNFLEVQGTRHRYRIHIGSTNIQILPDNRYLCIVPGRAKTTVSGFVPFEGDRGLSIVLSKAFMLVEDDKITDPTILSQLGR